MSNDESSCILFSSDDEIVPESDISTNDIGNKKFKYGNVPRLIVTFCTEVQEKIAPKSSVSQNDLGKQLAGDKLEEIVTSSSYVHKDEEEIVSECGVLFDSVRHELEDDTPRKNDIKFENDDVSSPEEDIDTSNGYIFSSILFYNR